MSIINKISVNSISYDIGADYSHITNAPSTDNFVEKEEGKGLSSNDFTNADKIKLNQLENYDDTDVRELIDEKVDKVEGKGLSTNDFTDEYRDKVDSAVGYDDTELRGYISDIEAKIPVQASSTNQLADKDFVNSSISTNTAYFRGTFESLAELQAYSGEKTLNDYAFVIIYDEVVTTLVKQYDRYKYNGTSWVFEYTLNNSSFTSEQWGAINSGITSDLVALIEPIPDISGKEDKSNKVTSVSSISTDTEYPSAKCVYDELQTKATFPQSYTKGNIPKFGSYGVLTDTGYKVTDFLTQHQDISGKEDITNKVSSISSASTNTQYPSAKCVYDNLLLKSNATVILVITAAMELPLLMNHNYEYRLNPTNTQGISSSIEVEFPQSINNDYISSIVFKSGEEATSFTYPEGIKWSGDDISDGEFVPASNKTYNVLFFYDGFNRNGIVRSVKI